MKITISGRIGAGKSTVAKELAKALGYRYYSTGDIMRKLANERHTTILKLSEEAETDPLIDKKIDEYQSEIGKTQDDFVMDSRLGFKFIPDAINIYLFVSLDESADRILSRKNSEEHYKDYDDALNSITERESTENERFMKLYHVDFTDPANYDLVINTNDLDVHQVVSTIVSFLRKMHLLTDKENQHLEEYFAYTDKNDSKNNTINKNENENKSDKDITNENKGKQDDK